MAELRTRDDVKAALERRLRKPVHEGFWELLIERGIVDEFLKGRELFEDLLYDYQRLLRAARKRRPAGPLISDLPPDERLRLRSHLLADEIAKEPWVTRFREAHLGGKTLPEAEAIAWLERHRKLEAPNGDWRQDRDAVLERAAQGVLGNLVEVQQPTGALGELNRAALVLARFVGWEVSHASLFILTGTVPMLPRARAELSITPFGATSTGLIRITAHPSTSPTDVVKQYRAVRQRWLALTPNTRPRRTKRPLGLLVEFVAARKYSAQGLTWREVFETWNAEHSEYAYRQLDNMRRDFRRALELDLEEEG